MPDSLREARLQLEALRKQCRDRNPDLYRDLALYLQVLRDGLLNAVRQACFHLAAEVHPERYLGMPQSQRQYLQRRLESLVRRALSLLTVEQLAALAAQMASERLEQLQLQRQDWLEGMGAPTRPPEAPPGSIQLGLQPPIGLALGESPLISTTRPGVHGGDPEPGGDPDPASPDDPMVAALQTVLEQLVSHEREAPSRPLETPSPWDQGGLPVDPAALLIWLEGFDRALSRRLRNLSHALNVELLRLGLARSLMPLSLLEAALAGRLDLQQCPVNLIRLPLASAEAMALLLRSSDLEQVLPALRTCRSRWRQQRLEVRRMAELSRRLQRRVQVLEAEELWLQDIASLQRQPPAHPSTAG